MSDEIKTWPVDQPNAIDPLQRHSLERAGVDPEYARTHREWVRWATRETAHREQKAARAASAERASAAGVEAMEARRKTRDEQHDARKAEQTAAQEKRVANLSRYVRRW